jgi:predicted signal transduction protein with EAL and GGDEF domain
VELQNLIGEIQIEVRAGKRLRLAASLGASVFPHDGTTYEALLSDADQRMYRDKAARRCALQPPHASSDSVSADLFETTTGNSTIRSPLAVGR